MRFPLIVGVIFIHNYGYQAAFADGTQGPETMSLMGIFVQNLFSQVLGRIAVPLFYAMSGYLFFNGFGGSMEDYFQKLKKRFSSLLIPFLFWNILLLVIVSLLQNSRTMNVFFNAEKIPILNYTWIDYVNAIFGIGRSPIATQFWFIRDLIILVIASPLIYYLARHLEKVALAVLLIMWYCDISTQMGSEPLFFFFAGCVFSIENINLEILDKYRFELTYVFIVLAIIDASTQTIGYSVPVIEIHKIAILIGILSAWSLTSILAQAAVSKYLRYLSYYSFFVFASHIPVVPILKKISFRFINPQTTISITLIYFIVPVLATFICFNAGLFLDKLSPGFYRLVTGNRNQ
jgi:surface polysaccharide O-acyltransferase-like enzyme